MENYIIIVLVFWIFTFLVWDKFFAKKSENDIDIDQINEENQKFKLELDQKNQKIWELRNELEQEKKERNELSWKSKQMFAEKTFLEAENKNLREKNSEITKQLTQSESERNQKDKEFQKMISDLENSRKSLEEEKQRIRREDEEEKVRLEKERDRMWADHETSSISKMKDVCQRSELWFSFYDNNTLPDTFDGKLKPDFLVEFLWQYIIFDAKISKSSNLQSYLSEQVKSTVKKIKDSKNVNEIYNIIYFIIPSTEISNIKKTFFYEDWYSFYLITYDSFEPILANFKKVKDYDLVEKFNPQERENIVNLIAAFDFHINKRNALDLAISIDWLKTLSLKNSLLENDLIDNIEILKKKMRIEKVKDSDLKRMIHDPEEQIKEIKNLILPKAQDVDLENIA